MSFYYVCARIIFCVSRGSLQTVGNEAPLVGQLITSSFFKCNLVQNCIWRVRTAWDPSSCSFALIFLYYYIPMLSPAGRICIARKHLTLLYFMASQVSLSGKSAGRHALDKGLLRVQRLCLSLLCARWQHLSEFSLPPTTFPYCC